MANESKTGDEPKIEELDKLIAKGKQKGFLTYDEVNDALPSDLVTLDQLDDIMLMFGSMDIELVDSTKAARLPSEMASPAADPRARRRGAGAAPHRLDPRPGRPHRGSGPPLPARDGQGRPAHPRGRDHARQAHRRGQGRGHSGHPLHSPRGRE